jgi:peptidoglycan/xylan/chitin deacetylase (PgdA/CDA1 family)
MRRWSHAAKYAIAHALYAVGLLQLWIAYAFRRKAVVLTYHRVLSDEAYRRTWSHPGIIVHRDTFERHLQVIRRLFRVLTVAELVAQIERREPFDGPCCVITFDDGWRDTFEEAWPALRHYGMPAVVFLPADFIGSNAAFWQERLGRLLHCVWRRCAADAAFRHRGEAMLPPGAARVLGAEAGEVRGAIHDLVQSYRNKAAGGDDPGRLASALESLLEGDDEPSVDRFMTWDEVRRMAADGVSFGGHGMSHTLLTTIPMDEVAREVRESKKHLEREVGRQVVAFSYPNGNWNAEIAEQVRQAGFRIAFSTERGTTSAGCDRFAVKRLNVHEDMTATAPMLLARMAGIF